MVIKGTPKNTEVKFIMSGKEDGRLKQNASLSHASLHVKRKSPMYPRAVSDS